MYNDGDILVINILVNGEYYKFEYKLKKFRGKKNILSLESDLYYLMSNKTVSRVPMSKENIDTIIEENNGYIMSPG